MTRSVAILIIFITALAISGCNKRSASADRLELAETLMWSASDSALTVLESISPDSLAKGEEKARYALLYTMAMDKNHLEPANDSLIASAVDYYKSKDNIPRLMVANFYRGRVLQHNGRHPQALLSFYQAKELAEKSDSSFWAGMACRDISDIYGNAYNRTEELTFAKKEYDYIKRSGRQPYLNYALYDVGKAYENNGDYQKAINIADQLIDSALVAQDAYLYYGALHLKSFAMIGNKNYSGAYQILENICQGEFAEYSDSLNMCITLVKEDRCKEALILLDKISDNNEGLKNSIKYMAYRKTRQFDKAIEEVEYVDSISDAIMKSNMRTNLTGTLSDYFEMDKSISESKLNASKIRSLLFIILSLVAFVAIIMFSLYMYLHQRSEIDRKVLFAEQLQEELGNTTENLGKTKEDLDKIEKNLEDTINDLNKTKVDLENTQQDLYKSKEKGEHSDKIIKYLLSSKYELLEELIEIVIFNNDSNIAKRKIADTVTRLIEDLSIQSNKIKELEINIDNLLDNLFSDFRKDLPNLKEADYRLFLFSILNISTPAISLLLKEEKIEAIYNRKRRLKNKIKKLGEIKSEQYLKYL